jgi:hypothetical protein
MVSAGLGAGQLGLGLANYLQNKDLNKKRISALDEQIKSAKYARNRHKEFVSNTRNSFGA